MQKYPPGTIARIRHSPPGMGTGAVRPAIRNGHDSGWVCTFGNGHTHFDVERDFEIVEVCGTFEHGSVSTVETRVPDDMVPVSGVLSAAVDLLGFAGDGPLSKASEWDEAIVSVVCSILDFPEDTKEHTYRILRALR